MPNDQDHSDEDPSDKIQRSQERIFKLRQERGKRLEEVMRQYRASIKNIQERVEAAKEEEQRKLAQKQADQVERILSSVRRRRMIEEDMARLAHEAAEMTGKTEALMEGGFRGREKDAMKHLGEKRGQKG